MKIINILLLVLFFILPKAKAQSEDDLFNADNSYLFAKYLFKSQQYISAAGEFERLSFVFAHNDSIKLMALECYLLANEPLILRNRSALLFENKKTESLDRLVVRSYFKEKNFFDALEYAEKSKNLQEEEKIYYNIYALLMQDKFKQAKSTPVPLVINPEYVSRMNGAMDLAAQGEIIKLKSPFLAGSMSAIVPGSGKFYTRDWKDGLIGLLTVGASAYQSVRGFQRRGVSSGYGWVFGGLATGFYFGNIYGSVQSAKRYNKKKKQNIRLKIENRFNTDYQPVVLQ